MQIFRVFHTFPIKLHDFQVETVVFRISNLRHTRRGHYDLLSLVQSHYSNGSESNHRFPGHVTRQSTFIHSSNSCTSGVTVIFI